MHMDNIAQQVELQKFAYVILGTLPSKHGYNRVHWACQVLTHTTYKEDFSKRICSQAQGYQLEIKTNRKKELVRTFSQQNQHTHSDEHEEKNLQ